MIADARRIATSDKSLVFALVQSISDDFDGMSTSTNSGSVKRFGWFVTIFGFSDGKDNTFATWVSIYTNCLFVNVTIGAESIDSSQIVRFFSQCLSKTFDKEARVLSNDRPAKICTHLPFFQLSLFHSPC